MRHKCDHRKLGLPSDQRRALLANLTRQLIRHGYVRTTLGRAKELQRVAEKLITVARTDFKEGVTEAEKLAARRKARRILVGHSASSPKPVWLAGKTPAEKLAILQERSMLNGEDLVKHLFDNIAPRYAQRNGGYTRLTKTGLRRGDAAPTAVVELIE